MLSVSIAQTTDCHPVFIILLFFFYKTLWVLARYMAIELKTKFPNFLCS